MLVTPAEREPPGSFQRDRDPAYFGRFRLWFDQLTPFIDDHRAFVPVRPDLEALAREAFGGLEPDQSWPIHLVRPAEKGADWAVEGGDPRRLYVVLEMLTDVCYIDARNLHRALDAFAPALEDARFFAYSSGDQPDDWLDEYEFRDGRLAVRRWRHEPDLLRSRMAFYRRLMKANSGDDALRSFVAEVRRRATRT
ncbi:hypothetical protein [Sorangium sp. So ce1335]|uniref:hypothetical protein n=1 Tax=Sorangium sp. So ce1335 TaxID=3133335 RepID=UPI003F623DB6